jgi:precorrin-8X/cobalt-precorrin-8 methylmutase
LKLHPIVQQSFAMIDQEIGEHGLPPEEYAVVRRVIHSTADFDFKELVRFSPGAIEGAIAALAQGCPIVVDVGMVAQGIRGAVSRSFQNPVITAVTAVDAPLPGRTVTESGLLTVYRQWPEAIYVIGNAPTALIALCELVQAGGRMPICVIGAPVGFVSVLESKAQLARTVVPQIVVEGRKGGSPVAASIVNALLQLAWDRQAGKGA